MRNRQSVFASKVCSAMDNPRQEINFGHTYWLVTESFSRILEMIRTN
jgi:hypothetical protein